MNRKAFTLVELLVCIVIIVILASLLITALGRSSWSDKTETFKAQCVKTYTQRVGYGDSATDSKRVDLRREGKTIVETVTCDDDWLNDVRNSGTLYGQFEAGEWYEVTTIGYRDEYWSYFPNVTAVRRIVWEPSSEEEIKNAGGELIFESGERKGELEQ